MALRDADSLAASLLRPPSARAGAGGGRARARAAAAPPAPDALLALRDECQAAKQRERAAEDKVRQLAAQLMRTEEAAKRILTRTDATAARGVAQRLLDAEREVARLKAELAEAESQLAVAKRQAADHKRQGAELKKRLDAALADQRRLALQLGRRQAGGRGLAALSANGGNALHTPPALAGGSPAQAMAKPGFSEAAGAAGDAAQAEAAAEAAATARRFAEQQELLVSTRERCAALQAQLQQRELLVQQQARALGGLQAELAGASAAPPPQPWGAGAPGAAAGGGPQRRSSSDGTEGGSASPAWLRLKYLKSKSAVDSLAASNTRLLQELEAARAQLQRLQAQQAAAHPPAPARGWSADDTPGSACSAGLGPAAPPAAAAAVLQLRQQLAESNHRAARLQIELDAATQKLAIYQAHSCQAQQAPQQGPAHARPPASQQREQPMHSRQDSGQHSVRAERVASWLRSAAAVSAVGELQPPAEPSSCTAAAHPCGGLLQQAAAAQPGVPSAGQGLAQEAEGLAEHENLVELHLFSAELAPSAPLGPLGLSLCTVDFWSCATQTTGLAEGRSPLFNHTLRFVAGMTPGLVEHLAAGTARVQLHCCRSGAAAVDYDTVATADIPLRTLLHPEPATQYQECALFGPDGAACGALKYALAALKPMRVHPGATQRPAAASQPSHQAAQHAPAASSRAQPVQAASRLAVSVVGCRDLRPPGGSARGAPGLQPYVTLLLPVPAPGQPPLLFETRTAAGSSPSFQERASFGLGGGAAAQVLEAVVFDAAAGGAAGGNGIIGVARIPLPPAGQGADGGATLHPLLHPTSGRHAGVLELGVRWE